MRNAQVSGTQRLLSAKYLFGKQTWPRISHWFRTANNNNINNNNNNNNNTVIRKSAQWYT